jgi:hypothetical protein
VKDLFLFIGRRGRFGPGWKPPVILSVLSLVFTDLSTAPDMYVILHSLRHRCPTRRPRYDRPGSSQQVREQNSCVTYNIYEVHIGEEILSHLNYLMDIFSATRRLMCKILVTQSIECISGYNFCRKRLYIYSYCYRSLLFLHSYTCIYTFMCAVVYLT